MPRPTRIQYEHAFYHVMNRGRRRQTIFHGKAYYQAFLKTLEEAHRRFDAIFHAYCLMGNHYHLLIETPRANLDRIMRHINGLYTQRYNRLKKTDGPLFRGRYKAILIDEDAYLLQLSRYIHRNPAEVKGAQAEILDIYAWSSYLAYTNKAKPECWLHRATIYQMLGHRHKYAGYKAYVEAGVDEDIKRFYSQGNRAAILGDQHFRESLAEKRKQLTVSGELARVLSHRPSMDDIVAAVARAFGVTQSSIVERKSGRQQANLPRKLAIYCCQSLGDKPLKTIAAYFGLHNAGSVSPAIHDIKCRLAEGELERELNSVEKYLNIIK